MRHLLPKISLQPDLRGSLVSILTIWTGETLKRGAVTAIRFNHGRNRTSPSPDAQAGKQRSYHRPPISLIKLLQQNKSFKSKHATKSSLKELAKGELIVSVLSDSHILSSGRTQRPSPKSSAASTAAQARLNRRNTQKQAQAAKRVSLVASTRIFNGVDGAPRIVAVIPLCEDIHAVDAVRALATSIVEDVDGIEENSPIWKMKCVPSCFVHH